MSRRLELFNLDDVHIFFVNDTELAEIENPKNEPVLFIGSLDSGMAIYGAEMLNITIQDLRRKDEGTTPEGEIFKQGSP